MQIASLLVSCLIIFFSVAALVFIIINLRRDGAIRRDILKEQEKQLHMTLTKLFGDEITPTIDDAEKKRIDKEFAAIQKRYRKGKV